MQLEIVAQCYYYQYRFCWMLSSILQQQKHNIDIVVTCSYLEDGSDGLLSNKSIINFFQKKGLNIIGYKYTYDKIIDRSYFRDDRTKNSSADWILFVDADMVYNQDFFKDLEEKLISDDYRNETKVLGADRVSLDIDTCENYIRSMNYGFEPIFVPHPVVVLKTFPVKGIGGGTKAPGFFQLIRGDVAKSVGKYCTKNNGFFADKSIRYLCGGVREIKNIKPQYHLNHYRDNRYNNQQK